MKQNIGIKITKPTTECQNDENCPFHGKLSVRGKVLTGVIVKAKAVKTAVFQLQRTVSVPKYERQEKRKTRIRVHNPECINAKEGDLVTISECKPISKTKRFVIIEKKGQEKHFVVDRDAKEEGKFKKTAKEIKNIAKEDKELKKENKGE